MTATFLVGCCIGILGLFVAYWEWRDADIIDQGRRVRPMDRR